MKVINSKVDLLENLETIENYLTSTNELEFKEIKDLIRLGSCLLCYKINDEIRFAPSRFIGYKSNNLEKHKKNKKEHNVDGRTTNVEITKVLQQKQEQDNILKNQFVNFCNSLGFEPANKKHKFWTLELDKELRSNDLLYGEFPEGKIIERKHKARERNSKVVEIAKSNFLKNHKGLFCEACGFDFELIYGTIGKDFIEGHHTIPVSQMRENHLTKPEDIVLLCSNCHRMVHKKRPWLTINEIKQIIKK